MSEQFNYQSGQVPQGDQQAYQPPQYQQNPYPQQGYQYQAPQYQQPPAGQSYNNEHMTVGNWIVTYLLMMIPIANIVLMFVWAFSSDTKRSKKTWAQASLIMAAIGIALTILISIIIAVAGINLFRGLSNSYY